MKNNSNSNDAPAVDNNYLTPESVGTLSVREIQLAIENQAFTTAQLVGAFLARIGRYNSTYNAVIELNPDALVEAHRIDARRALGEPLGPLAGIPIVIKDTIDCAGLPTTGGWRFLSSKTNGVSLIPNLDAPVVARLREAGAIILGKTNVSLLSLSGTNTNDSWAGPTYNAHSLQRAPGASSAGSATAIACGFAVFSLGEETGGSIQNPAAAQGLVSIKPSFALIPNIGVLPLASSTRDVVGPISKTIEDAAIALNTLAGYTADDPKTVASIGNVPREGYTSKLCKDRLRGRRIGLFGPGWRNVTLTAETQILYARAVEELEALGAIVIHDPFARSGFSEVAKPSKLDGLNGYDARGEESVAHDLENYFNRLGSTAPIRSLKDLIDVTGQDPFADGGYLAYHHELDGFTESLADVTKAPNLTSFLHARELYISIFNEVMSQHQLDALVFPQMRRETPLLFSSEVILETTVSEIDIGGFPGITVPAGFYPSGSPFALIFVGRLWDEANLLGLAYSYEQATLWCKQPKLAVRPKINEYLSAGFH
ncbi:amidase [Pseudomonas sp. RIT-PI-q]|uniref:amidase n=1 Tax=Pseudomonas sp. RIT-PI-q TaxID=1690247 RepID=UPI0009E96D0F|nr:amidase [Pseudomonas sp. RIT-PI-q]